jgi:carboxyl-terminal processing protease
MQNFLRGRIVGIGSMIEPTENGFLDVVRVLRNSPSERAGLRSHDRIVRMEGRRLDEMKREEVTMLFRGAAGTPLRIQVQRENQLIDLTIVRDNIELETASGELIPPDIGFLRVNYFGEETPRQARGILLELKNRSVRGLVLDLRGNSGGSLEAALQFLDLFVPNGKVVVQLEDRSGRREAFKSRGTPILEVPIVVLVDSQTGSSTEIVSRALAETNRARLVGEPTYGKATAEEILPLKNGYAAKISIKRILSGQGKSWEAVGLSPDVVVKADPEALKQAEYAVNVEERLRLDIALRSAIRLLLQ